ncbi:MAG: hypothetical protein C4532_07815 [Candidatus Abyssobacteria bacterium SURF_17]|uniref:Uncharacterized protein n=1 Tax=Candidatus Abyssobacteria bacterium SURF_17 TaxID=2093361 RepID=A0A419F0H1_9BACT|nr:MAG: hypothetical protein C4532_07815 [Candidatus Abyssubacteria bacterium SURF_17]
MHDFPHHMHCFDSVPVSIFFLFQNFSPSSLAVYTWNADVIKHVRMSLFSRKGAGEKLVKLKPCGALPHGWTLIDRVSERLRADLLRCFPVRT